MKKQVMTITELKKMDEIIASMNGIANRLHISINGNGLDESYSGLVKDVERQMKEELFDAFLCQVMSAEFCGSDTAYIEDKRDGMKYSITIYMYY